MGGRARRRTRRRRGGGLGARRPRRGVPRATSPTAEHRGPSGPRPPATTGRRCRPRRRRDPRRWPGRRSLRARPAGRRPRQRGARRRPGPRPARVADRRPRAVGALPGVPVGLPGRPARGRGHPFGRLRAGPRPGAGGHLGRRRRPARRAARAVPPRPRGARAAGRGRGHRDAPRRLRPLDEAAMLLRSGWARELVRDRAVVRARARIDVVPAEDRAVGRGCRGRPSRRSARGWRRPGARADVREPATRRRSPASGAAPRPGAAAVPDRWCCADPRRRRPAVGAARPTRAGRAASAATGGSALPCAARRAPPRSSAGRSPARPCAARAATACSPGWGAPRHRGRHRRAPSRRPRVATPPSSSSTPG